MKANRLWLFYAVITTSFWGVWGAFIEVPEKSGFPATLGFAVWAITTVPCTIFAMGRINWKLEYDTRSVFLGMSAGFMGSGGQLLLFLALRHGPAYIVFPIISLYPILTILLSLIFLKEKATIRQWSGIIFALIAIFFLSNPRLNPVQPKGLGWMILAILVFILWGLQAYIIKWSNNTMQAESIYFYLACSSLLLIPAAIIMTDFSTTINWGFHGPWLAAIIQLLNSIGALTFFYALHYGKAIVVVPLTGLAPAITIILSLIFYGVTPGGILLAGLLIAVIALVLLSE